MPGQLHKRQRGIAPPAPSEFALQCAVVDVIRRWIMPGWRFGHIPLGELRDKITAARLWRMGVTRGWPDLMFFHADGRCAFLEVKRPGGRLSGDQQRIAEHLKRAGHGFEVVDSVEAAISVLVVWGVVRAMVVQ
jgi:VRR-NUC domain